MLRKKVTGLDDGLSVGNGIEMTIGNMAKEEKWYRCSFCFSWRSHISEGFYCLIDGKFTKPLIGLQTAWLEFEGSGKGWVFKVASTHIYRVQKG